MGKQETLWTVDSLPIDVLTLKFSGSVELDPYDDEDRALYEALKMGKHVEFTVAGVVAGKAHTYKPPKGENLSVTTRVATIKVDTLVQEADEDEVEAGWEYEQPAEQSDALSKAFEGETAPPVVLNAG